MSVATFEPRLNLLPEAQWRMWMELEATVPPDFVLYGGMATALRLGHRASEDFDFYSSHGFDPDRLRAKLPFFLDLDPADPNSWISYEHDHAEALLNRGGAVKVAFFGRSDTEHRIEDPMRAVGSKIRVASLVDLAAMKMRTVQVPGKWTDYADIHALLSNGIDLATALAAARAIDENFDPATAIRALESLDEEILVRVPAATQRDLRRWAHSVDLDDLPIVRPRRGLTPLLARAAGAG